MELDGERRRSLCLPKETSPLDWPRLTPLGVLTGLCALLRSEYRLLMVTTPTLGLLSEVGLQTKRNNCIKDGICSMLIFVLLPSCAHLVANCPTVSPQP